VIPEMRDVSQLREGWSLGSFLNHMLQPQQLSSLVRV